MGDFSELQDEHGFLTGPGYFAKGLLDVFCPPGLVQLDSKDVVALLEIVACAGIEKGSAIPDLAALVCEDLAFAARDGGGLHPTPTTKRNVEPDVELQFDLSSKAFSNEGEHTKVNSTSPAANGASGYGEFVCFTTPAANGASDCGVVEISSPIPDGAPGGGEHVDFTIPADDRVSGWMWANFNTPLTDGTVCADF